MKFIALNICITKEENFLIHIPISRNQKRIKSITSRKKLIIKIRAEIN